MGDSIFDNTILRVGAVVVASVAALGAVGFAKNYFDKSSVNSSSASSSTHSKNNVIHIKSRTEFVKYVSDKDGAAVVDYSASWCGPCKMIAPTYEKLSGQYPNIKFLHVDIDELAAEIPEIASVRGVPTFVFYKNGLKVSDFSGADIAKLEASVKSIAK